MPSLRGAPLSPNGFWRSEPAGWWVVSIGGWQRDGGACERYCLLPLRGLLAAKQYLDCTYTRPNSSAVTAAVPSMLLRHACRARARVQGVGKVTSSSLGRDKLRMDRMPADRSLCLFSSTFAEFYSGCILIKNAFNFLICFAVPLSLWSKIN